MIQNLAYGLFIELSDHEDIVEQKYYYFARAAAKSPDIFSDDDDFDDDTNKDFEKQGKLIAI